MIALENLLVSYNLRSARRGLIYMDFVFLKVVAMFCDDVLYMFDCLRSVVFLLLRDCSSCCSFFVFHFHVFGHYTSAFFSVRGLFVASSLFFFLKLVLCFVVVLCAARQYVRPCLLVLLCF